MINSNDFRCGVCWRQGEYNREKMQEASSIIKVLWTHGLDCQLSLLFKFNARFWILKPIVHSHGFLGKWLKFASFFLYASTLSSRCSPGKGVSYWKRAIHTKSSQTSRRGSDLVLKLFVDILLEKQVLNLLEFTLYLATNPLGFKFLKSLLLCSKTYTEFGDKCPVP